MEVCSMSTVIRKPPALCSQCEHFTGLAQNKYGICKQSLDKANLCFGFFHHISVHPHLHKNPPPVIQPGAGQMIDKPIVENLGCMKGPQPLLFLSAGGGVHVAEEKIPEGPLARPRGNFHSAQIFCPCAFKRTRKFAIRRK